MPNINGGERTSEKRKRVTRPASLSPLNPAMALGSLLSVALSSVTAKSIYMIPSVAICVNVQPRRHGCTVLSDGGVQFTPTTLFSFKRRRCSTTPLYSPTTLFSFKRRRCSTTPLYSVTTIRRIDHIRITRVICRRCYPAKGLRLCRSRLTDSAFATSSAGLLLSTATRTTFAHSRQVTRERKSPAA